jgi:uncharacterized membrane protein
MPVHVRPADPALLSKVAVSTASRDRFLRRAATAVTAFAAGVAVVVVSLISLVVWLT